LLWLFPLSGGIKGGGICIFRTIIISMDNFSHFYKFFYSVNDLRLLLIKQIPPPLIPPERGKTPPFIFPERGKTPPFIFPERGKTPPLFSLREVHDSIS